jgi:L-ascorbate metabolism protein UlaG (beta-lactamase superfamily)
MHGGYSLMYNYRMFIKRFSALVIAFFAVAVCGAQFLFAEGIGVSKLLYQGHASFRLTTSKGVVVYIDPFAGKGYDVPADIILVTHEHQDHNNVGLVTQKKTCLIIRAKDMLVSGVYKSIEADGIKIQAVEAYNRNHPKSECVGFVITLEDGIMLYHAGDTSLTEDMKTKLPLMKIDYAFYPCDGVYNMDVREAAKCASYVGAKHSVPIHTKPGELFDLKVGAVFAGLCPAGTSLIIKPGEAAVVSKE